MHDRLIKVQMSLLQELEVSETYLTTVEDLSERLKSQGFSEGELDAALLWLMDRLRVLEHDHDLLQWHACSVRVTDPTERVIISPEAYGYLLHLETSGVIERHQVETVIEKALSSGMTEITLHDMQMITSAVVFQSDWPENPFQRMPSNGDDGQVTIH